MKALLRDASDAVALRKSPPPTTSLLVHRGESDVQRLLDVLHASGYYAARVEVQLAGSPARRLLVFEIRPGPRYRLGAVVIDAGGAVAPSRRTLGLKRGLPARSTYVAEAEDRLLREMRLQGHPFPQLAERHYRVDPTGAVLNIRFRVEPGPAAVFGATAVTGLVRVKEGFVRNEIEWQEGDAYSPKAIDDTRTEMMRSALFSTIRLQPAEALDDNGALAVELSLKERRRRTVALGVGYRTDEGAGATAAWEHRNLYGGAEKLRFRATVAEASRGVEAGFTKPQFRRRDQTLLLTMRAAEDSPEAYESRSLRTAALLERDWSPDLEARLGAAFRYTVVDQLDDEDDFILASVPASLDWNTSDDPLDARQGGRLLVTAEPFYDLLGRNVGFVKGTTTANRYVPFDRDRNWVLAGRATVGSLMGAGRTKVPADERFYAGGGSSIRGYGYQTVGPLEDDDPVGGRSLLELSAELRVRVTPSFGLVAFLDGGTAFASPVPDFDETVQWGAGLGVRYFTVVGPVRADVGVPVDKREGLDKDYQFYVSIGQAF